MRVEKAAIEDLDEIVCLHEKEFKGGLSELLGENFLFNFYKNLLKNKNCAIFVAKSDNEVIGFIAGSADGKYQSLEMQYKIVKMILIKCVTDLKFILEIIRLIKRKYYYITLRIKAELIAVVVKSEYRRKGAGKELVKKLEDFFIKNKVNFYYVFADDNVSDSMDFYYFSKFKKVALVGLLGYSGTFLRKSV